MKNWSIILSSLAGLGIGYAIATAIRKSVYEKIKIVSQDRAVGTIGWRVGREGVDDYGGITRQIYSKDEGEETDKTEMEFPYKLVADHNFRDKTITLRLVNSRGKVVDKKEFKFKKRK